MGIKYIIIDKKTGLDISNDVLVIKESTDDFLYCRRMADKMIENAEEFYEKEIDSRHKLIHNAKMEDFGNDYDITRSEKWLNYINKIYSEIEKKWKELNEMYNIAGDWEDKEYAERWKYVVNFLASRSENPLIEKESINKSIAEYVTYMGAPNLAKYLI